MDRAPAVRVLPCVRPFPVLRSPGLIYRSDVNVTEPPNSVHWRMIKVLEEGETSVSFGEALFSILSDHAGSIHQKGTLSASQPVCSTTPARDPKDQPSPSVRAPQVPAREDPYRSPRAPRGSRLASSTARSHLLVFRRDCSGPGSLRPSELRSLQRRGKPLLLRPTRGPSWGAMLLAQITLFYGNDPNCCRRLPGALRRQSGPPDDLRDRGICGLMVGRKRSSNYTSAPAAILTTPPRFDMHGGSATIYDVLNKKIIDIILAVSQTGHC
ncbi:hypothetical protein NDU88_010533 [Pleurodeles waltl]|uniref:Uncharacterized protein n=1 Tax=Pleurodeles waltl TaxID=8319 RepID=A0AAV7QXM6_PLEWA|nr:hypothetical protein NDU88_010533 [Pleurodeles waltl]